ncbi:hypothetical protein LTR62_007243 [Meristemomyces frigidus]|uniref:Uncharacterized protein n=1 Tax=Meristemomyces frigidus TaxID=1508187 RepID=A0AAN7YI11_9PEZI|nr:hypothetical protein LTR62_007243 [Meristemomyces frigidus]
MDNLNSGFPPAMASDFLAPERRFSMADSLGMLRSLSMSGNLGMPALMVPMENWQQRRPSGRVFEEAEINGVGGWRQGVGSVLAA